jgi:hypothetical protein
MTAKKQQQVKKQEPVPNAESNGIPMDTIVAQEGAPTTIKLKVETKGRLEILKGMLGLDDYDATVSKLIDTIPQKLSTEQEVHLVMTQSKFIWLRGHQDNCDCRQFLDEAKV